MFRRAFAGVPSSWREMERLRREMNRLFADWPSGLRAGVTPSYPAMNVWTSEENALVTAELPGVHPEDIDITVEGDVLHLSGSRQPQELGEGETYHRRERGYGRFTRAFQLPFEVEADKVEAVFDKGVLHVTLPRALAQMPKKITVKSG